MNTIVVVVVCIGLLGLFSSTVLGFKKDSQNRIQPLARPAEFLLTFSVFLAGTWAIQAFFFWALAHSRMITGIVPFLIIIGGGCVGLVTGMMAIYSVCVAFGARLMIVTKKMP